MRAIALGHFAPAALVVLCASAVGAGPRCDAPTPPLSRDDQVPATAAQQDASPRLVVYVLFDTLGAGHVSHLGYDRATTPHFDSLAAAGIAFENAISPAPYAVASIPSLMTGKYPDRHGLTEYEGELAEHETTLAEVLADAGFRTVAFSSVYQGGPSYGNDQGFARFVELYLGPGPEGSTRTKFKGETCHFPAPSEYLPLVRGELDALDSGEKLFLFVHFLQPHGPYDPPNDYTARFRDERSPGSLDAEQRDALRKRTRKGQPSAQDVEAIIRLYDGNLAWADDGLGQIIAELKTRGLFDGALIIATGNHGEAFWQHGRRGHGVHLHGEVMRVPAVVKLPAGDQKVGLKRTQLVSNIDLAPTILGRLGLSYPEGPRDGRSLLPLITQAEGMGHEKVFLRNVPKPGYPPLIALQWADRKVIVTLEPEESGQQGIGEVLFYDLLNDPGEQRNLASARPAAATQAAREALEFYRGLNSPGKPCK